MSFKKFFKKISWVDYRGRVDFTEIALDVVVTIVVATVIVIVYTAV